MLALLVLVSGAMVIFQSYRASLQSVRSSRELFAASLLMESRIGEMEKTGRWNALAAADPVLGPVSWEDAVESEESPNLKRHRVTLAWGEGKKANTLEQSVYVWN